MSALTSIGSAIKSVVNQTDRGGASSQVVSAIKNAAAKTGVDFSYLLQKASQESGLDPSAKASTSSASGLFQFTNQTWLKMVKADGAQYGLGAFASQISTDSSGHLSVSDPEARQAILALRNDPQISAEMAGELDKQNAASLQQNVGGKISSTDLYLAHFLGAGGASEFLSTMRANPTATGASVLPEAAAANSSVFYTRSGQPKTLADIYDHFAQKFDGSVQLASAGSSSSTFPSRSFTATLPSAPVISPMASTSSGSASVSGFRVASARGMAVSGTSTLFTAMLMGQLNGAEASPNPALSAAAQENDKKRNAMAVLSAVA